MVVKRAIEVNEVMQLLVENKPDYSRRLRPQHEILADELFSRELKCCGRCGEIQSISEFTKDRNRKHGLKVYCKTCCKIERDANKEYNAQKSKEWREANPDRFKERRDIWMKAHPQSESETRQKWLEENKERVRQIKAKYRARRMVWEIGNVDYLEILLRDKFVCHICGCDVEPEDVHFDHLIPLSKGGAHSNDNIHVAHSKCNIRKGAKTLEEAQLVEKVTATIKSG